MSVLTRRPGHTSSGVKPGAVRSRPKASGRLPIAIVRSGERPEDNLRVLGPLPRFRPAWKRLYRLRMSIERIFRSLKHSRGLEGHMVRGIKKITLLATMSLLTYQATALARVKAGDFDQMRRMRVQVS